MTISRKASRQTLRLLPSSYRGATTFYTDEKNPETELLVEDALDAHDIFYEKTEVWIESERLYEVLYTFERKVSYAE